MSYSAALHQQQADPALGFEVPERHFQELDFSPRSVGTDPSLTLMTRRGTGYYKVPSLNGVWYRGPFEHNGSVAALDDCSIRAGCETTMCRPAFEAPARVAP